MNYAKIRKIDISNGPGIRVSLFVQGCTFNCKDCFNPETHSFSGGSEFRYQELELLLSLCAKTGISGLSILGGEPLHCYNVDCVIDICKRFKELYHNKSIWLWSGFKYETIKENISQQNILDYIDVLVDGQFKTELKDYSLKYRGSANQRVIDVKETIKNNKIVFIEGV